MRLLFLILLLSISSCARKQVVEKPEVPFPADSTMIYYQAQCDSGYQDFWVDIKAVASAFLNNSSYQDRGIKSDKIVIKGEGLFHGTVEIQAGDTLLVLTMERKFKSKGRRGIWQVTTLRKEPWPAKNSKSGRRK